MLCKAENRDPAHCLKEGRRVTRCAQDLYVSVTLLSPAVLAEKHTYVNVFPASSRRRITKLRENCLAEFEKHWNCLEYNNQVSTPIVAAGCAAMLDARWAVGEARRAGR